MNKLPIYLLKFATVHTITYWIIGMIAYPLLTKDFYIGENAVFSSFMVTQEDGELFYKVVAWILPGQILRGILIGLAFYPFYSVLNSWTYQKRFFTIAFIYIVIGFWASAVAAPGTIDGMIYMRPEITIITHLKVQPEIIIQGLLMSAWISKWMKPKNIT
jgi:hypothetical protein